MFRLITTHQSEQFEVFVLTRKAGSSFAIIYSIVETAKTNNLKPFDYVQYLLEEILKDTAETNRSFSENLLPWSENLPAEIRKAYISTTVKYSTLTYYLAFT